MFFIGIITNQKNELYIRNALSNFLQEENIIFINDKNISNIKNVRFETIIIDYKIDNKQELRNIISNTKYVILNSDIETNLEILNDLKLTGSVINFKEIEKNRVLDLSDFEEVNVNKLEYLRKEAEQQFKSVDNYLKG